MNKVLILIIFSFFHGYAFLEFTGQPVELEAPLTAPLSSSSFTVSLTNTDDSYPVTSLTGFFGGSEYSFLGGSFPGIGGNCAATLNPLSSCDIVIDFTPLASGDNDDTIYFNYALSGLLGAFNYQLSLKIDGHSENTGTPNCSQLAPVISNINPPNPDTSAVTGITLTGNNFSPSTSINIPGLSYSNLVINNYGSISFDLTTDSVEALYDLEVTNECGTTIVSDAISVETSLWLDLRTPGDLTTANPVFTNGEYTYTVDPNLGMQLDSNFNDWLKFLRFNGACGSVNQDFDMVVYRSNNNAGGMYGLWNQASQVTPYPDPNIDSYLLQYIGYWDLAAEAINRVYGTQDGEGGVGWTQAFGTLNIPNGNFYRYSFSNAGQSGQTLSIYQVDTFFNDVAFIGSFVSNKPASPAINVCLGVTSAGFGQLGFYITGIRVQ